MARIRLKDKERVAFLVLGVNSVQEDDKTLILFRGSTLTDPGAEFTMSPDSAKRQLDRIQFNWSTVVGQTVEFEKTVRGDRKFININRTDPLGTGASAAPAPSLPPVAGMSPAGNIAMQFVAPPRQAPPTDLPPMATAPVSMPAPQALSGDAKAAVWSAIAADLQMCLGIATTIAQDVLGPSPDGGDPIGYTSDNVCSLASTLFIAGQKRGLVG